MCKCFRPDQKAAKGRILSYLKDNLKRENANLLSNGKLVSDRNVVFVMASITIIAPTPNETHIRYGV